MAEGRGANYNPKHQELADRTQTRVVWGLNLLARMNFFVLNTMNPWYQWSVLQWSLLEREHKDKGSS